MTPCKEKGYRAGDEFVVIEDHWGAKKGEKLTLLYDDGTSHPCFEKHTKGGYERYFPHLNWVEKVTTGGETITRTNGQPYATEASARQQLTAKGLQDTHEVVPHEGGYALAPINRDDDPITLQPGDYVSTEGMTEEQYHAVARAFENAGCPRFCPEDGKGTGEILEWYDGALFSCLTPEDGGRHLTIEQVLGATNAAQKTASAMKRGKTEAETLQLNGWGVGDILEGNEGRGADQILITHVGDERFGCRWKRHDRDEFGSERFNTTLSCREWRKVGAVDVDEDKSGDNDPITTLKQARQARDEAEQAYQEALEEAREYLGEGFELTEVGTDGPLVDGEDMTDPANWREGDVVECVRSWPCGTQGNKYTIGSFDRITYIKRDEGVMAIPVTDDDGDNASVAHHYFRFHHRPA